MTDAHLTDPHVDHHNGTPYETPSIIERDDGKESNGEAQR